MATGIKSIISNMLPSLYKNVGKTEAKNPLDFGYDPSFMYQPRIKKATGKEVIEGQLQPRTEDGYTEYELKLGENVDKSLKNYIGAPQDMIDKAITQIHKNASRTGSFAKQFTEEDVRNRFNQLAEEAQRQQKASGGFMLKALEQAEGDLYIPSAQNIADDEDIYMIEEERSIMAEGGEIEDQMGDLMMMEEQEEMPMQEEPMPEMLPDEEMEEDYMDFVINESLSQEEEDYLFEKLNEDEMLSVIFDKVIETASEFSGAGPVEGPGSGVSDSIPARLSDGEFVMTSKAANQIGPDNLQGLMEVAEMEADEEMRRTMQVGGYVNVEEEEDEEIVRSVQPKERQGSLMPKSLADKKVSESMIALNPRNSLFVS
jgi:hypothetical protein